MWLSDEMALALAAIWPPLDAADVMRAADELMAPPSRRPARVHLLRPEDERSTWVEPGMLEALRALHDLGG